MKTLDEIKEEMADAHEISDQGYSNDIWLAFEAGFTACQTLTIDRRDVKLLVEEVNKIMRDPVCSSRKAIAHWSVVLESLYRKHPEMKEG